MHAGKDENKYFHYISAMDPEISARLAQLRKLERQAKQLIYKMDRIVSQWNVIQRELKEKGKEVPRQLGDVLHGWQKKSVR